MRVIQTDFKKTLNELQTILQKDCEEDVLGYFICDKTNVIIPAWNNIEKYNEEFVNRVNIDKLFLPVKGGTIVTNTGDLGFFYMTKDMYSMWNTAIEKFLAKYLQDFYTIDAYINGNDVLIDNKKFIGTASGFIDNWHVFGCFISMNNDTTWLINKICLKESKYKGFVGLNKYDVCPRKLIQAIINFSKRWEARAL